MDEEKNKQENFDQSVQLSMTSMDLTSSKWPNKIQEDGMDDILEYKSRLNWKR